MEWTPPQEGGVHSINNGLLTWIRSMLENLNPPRANRVVQNGDSNAGGRATASAVTKGCWLSVAIGEGYAHRVMRAGQAANSTTGAQDQLRRPGRRHRAGRAALLRSR